MAGGGRGRGGAGLGIARVGAEYGAGIRHDWDLSPSAARALQAELSARVDTVSKWEYRAGRLIGAADVSFDRGSDVLFAAVVVARRLEDGGAWEVLDRSTAVSRARFPYVPGLLSFREAPAVLEAFGGLSVAPEALLCDGQGIAHPRRFGLACHLGLWLDLPTAGLAKSRLWGEHEEPGPEAGSMALLRDRDGTRLGAVLRTRAGAKPLYVSPGHRMDADSALRLATGILDGRRVPFPQRLAHECVNAARRSRKESERESGLHGGGC